MGGSIRCAVAGNPAAHSMSPDIFYKFFEATGVSGFYSRIAADSLKEVLDTAKIAGITRLNITSPFKQDAALCSTPSSIAEKLMAANTLVLASSDTNCDTDCAVQTEPVISAKANISAFNTDYLGVYRSVKNIFPAQVTGNSKKQKTGFVIGAGGAGIAAAYGLSLAGFNVTVFNRTLSKALEKIKWIKNCTAASLENINQQIHNADIIVNALPVNDIFFDITKVKKEAVIFDANYKNSVLTQIAAENGLQTISGLKWLVNQAIASFEIFTGQKLSDDCIDLFNGENPVYDKKNISLIGFMGSGKTTTAKILADLFDTDFIDIDKEIEKKENMTIADIFKHKNENYFRQTEKRITEAVFNNEKGKVIACGGGAVTNSESRKVIASKSFPVWLAAPPEVSVKRISNNSRPLLNTISTEKKLEEAVKLFNERIDFYGVTSSIIIDSSKRGPQELAKKLYEEISLVFKK